MKNVQLPDGSVGEFPDTMPDASIEAVLRKQYGGGQPAPSEGNAALDVVGRLKQWATQEPPKGSSRDNPVARSIRNVGRVVMPGTIPSAVASTFSLVRGAGPLYALGRTAASSATAAAIEKLRGGDPSEAALEAGGQTALGEVAGGATRSAGRYIMSKLDPLARNVATVIGDLVPAFRGPTPRGTLVKAMGTEGQVALGKQYGEAVDRAIEQAGNPVFGGGMGKQFMSPKVQAILERSGKGPQPSPVPGYEGPADKVWAQIKSDKNRLMTLSRDPARLKDVFQRLDAVHEAEDAFAKAIEAKLPVSERGVFEQANMLYRQGKEMQRLFSPSGRMTAAKAQKIMGPGEGLSLDQPTLATNLMLRAGKLKEAFGPKGYEMLDQAIQRGSPLGARDIPGSMPHMRMHLGFIPSVYGLPHAPKLVGRPEAQSDILAQIMRRLGTRVAGTQAEAQ